MSQGRSQGFEHLEKNARNDFVINLYAATYCVVDHARLLAESAGGTVNQLFERYPFLMSYFDEMRERMPPEITWDEAIQWWRDSIEGWESRAGTHLPIAALAEHAELSFAARLALMVAGLVEEDSRVGTLFSELQTPMGHRRPTLEMLGRVVMCLPEARDSDPWSICEPLISAGLLDAQNRDAPRSEWLLRVPSLVWDGIRGKVSSTLSPECRLHDRVDLPKLEELAVPEAFLRKLEKLPALLEGGRVKVLTLRGGPGADGVGIVGALARALNRGVIEVNGKWLASEAHAQLGPLATLTCALPCVSLELGPGETTILPTLSGYRGPMVVLLGETGGVKVAGGTAPVTLEIPVPEPQQRAAQWRRSLGSDRTEGLLENVVKSFHLGGKLIRELSTAVMTHAELEGRDQISLDDVRAASRALNRQMLDNLANPVPAEGTWEHFVSAYGTREKLLELERRCRFREDLNDHLGTAFGKGAQRGVRALFTGVSGTGKTLAARILASVLGMDLYRVDLAAVVNKYIGETEKNLHQVLSRAEALDVLLLLDEGDSLLGSRTDVKSANDRYANLETNYLLQRLEHYQGVVVVTTNLGENIDRAFQRRMDVVVPFFPPEPAERLQIWQLHLSDSHAVDGRFLERAAATCALTGSQIRSAVLHATLLAIEEGGLLRDRHLDAAIRSEYRKAGGLCPMEERVPRIRDGGVKAFIAAFSRN